MKKLIGGQESDALVIDESSLSENQNPLLLKESPKSRGHLLNTSEDPMGEKVVAEWKQREALTKDKTLIANIIPVSDLMIFELEAGNTAIKTSWNSLPLRIKEVFEEIIYSLPLNENSQRNDDGCYTFSYTDDEYNLSVISIVIKGKAALFYKKNGLSED